jgi:hypothetical protein
MKGFFQPKKQKKYKGDIRAIIYRSSLELRYMCWLDDSPNVLSWSSEEIAIVYKDKATGRFRRYFPDFWYKTKARQYLIEIKPSRQCKPPIPKKNKTYINEVRTYATNTSKWEAARQFARAQGMEFLILTEKELALL